MGGKPARQRTGLPDGDRERPGGSQAIRGARGSAPGGPAPSWSLTRAAGWRRPCGGRACRGRRSRRRDRFPAEGAGGPRRDATRPPGRKPVPEDRVKAPVGLAMPPPPPHARHRAVRALAGKPGMARSTVRGILKAGGLRPHRVRTSRVPRGPRSGIRVRGVVGLHVDPPGHAAVLPVDGKTRIQAPGRTRRPPPMTPGHARTRAHACRRNGATCLPAALDVATGMVTGQTVGRHRPAEFRAFPGHAAEGIDPGTPARAIPGSVPPHRSAGVRGWLKGRPDRTFHLTPTPAPWTDAARGVPRGAVPAAAEGRGPRPACRVRGGDRGIHRAPQRQRRPPVPLEPQAGGPRRGLQERPPEAPGNGIR